MKVSLLHSLVCWLIYRIVVYKYTVFQDQYRTPETVLADASEDPACHSISSDASRFRPSYSTNKMGVYSLLNGVRLKFTMLLYLGINQKQLSYFKGSRLWQDIPSGRILNIKKRRKMPSVQRRLPSIYVKLL